MQSTASKCWSKRLAWLLVFLQVFLLFQWLCDGPAMHTNVIWWHVTRDLSCIVWRGCVTIFLGLQSPMNTVCHMPEHPLRRSECHVHHDLPPCYSHGGFGLRTKYTWCWTNTIFIHNSGRKGGGGERRANIALAWHAVWKLKEIWRYAQKKWNLQQVCLF